MITFIWNVQKRQNYRVRRTREWIQWAWGFFLGWWKLIVLKVAQLCEYTKNHWTEHCLSGWNALYVHYINKLYDIFITVLSIWYRWSYLQNRDTNIENKWIDTSGGRGWDELGAWDWHMYTTDTMYKIDTNKNLLYSSGSSNLVLQMNVKSGKVRWRRNRTGRSLSLLQIHRKNNRTVNKVYKTTSDR